MRFSTLGVCVHTEDVPAVRAFYVDVLGFAVTLDIGWFVGLRHPDHDDLDLCVVHRDHALPGMDGPVAGVVLAFLVEDVHAEHARLVELGVPVDVAPRDEPWGQRRCLVRDPAGTGVELVQATAPDPAWLASLTSAS
jgi:catechol 2,3-dioxygenase-like lactoylglutathione lyase family enzyme